MNLYKRPAILALACLMWPVMAYSQALRVTTMPSWTTNHAWSNFLFNDSILIWGTAFGGTPPYQDTIKIDGIWIPNSSIFQDPHPVTGPSKYMTGHLFSRYVVFYSCGFHTVELKVTDAAGNTAVSQSLILIHNEPPFNLKVNMVIERGLVYLMKNALINEEGAVYWAGWDGSVGNYDDYTYASTAASVLAFEENYHFYHNDSAVDPYAVMLRRGMKHLFAFAGQLGVYNHDDGTGLKISDLFTENVGGSGFCSTGSNLGSYVCNGSTATYANSFGLLAIILSQPDSATAASTLIGSGCFTNWSYAQFLLDALDFIYFYQGDFSTRGGWGYTLTNSGYYDGSLEQWPSLVLAAASARLGMHSPQWIMDNVEDVYAVMTNVNGGCGYAGPWSENVGKTGGMLASYAWTGKLVSNGDPEAVNALEYIGTQYGQEGGAAGGMGWAGYFYAMYAMKKGLALQEITFVDFNGTPRDWYLDMVAWLTGEELCSLPPDFLPALHSPGYAYGQHSDGSWTDGGFFSSTALATAHGILVLTPNIFDIPEPPPTPLVSICEGDSVQLTCSSGTSVEWYSDPPGYFSTQTAPWVTPASSMIYYAYVYDDLGCIHEVDSIQVNFWDVTQPQAAYNDPLCLGDTLSLSSQPGDMHEWTGPGGFLSGQQSPQIPAAGPSVAGWYYVTMKDTNHCFAFDSIWVEVHDLPVTSVSANSPVCTHDSLLLHATGGTVFHWDGPSGFGSVLQNPVVHGFQLSQSGYYYVTVTDSLGCASGDSVLVQGLESPLAAAQTNAPVCEGDTLLLEVTGGNTWLWQGPGGFSQMLQTLQIPDAQPGMSGQYMVVAFDLNQCKDTAWVDVLVRTAPHITGLQYTMPACHGDSNGAIQVTVTGGSQFLYEWNCCPGINSPSLGQLPAGWYTLTVTNGEGCSRTDSVQLVQPGPFSVQVSSLPDTCRGRGRGAIFISSVTGQNPPYTFTWSNGVTTPDNLNLFHGTYQLTITDLNGCDSVMSVGVDYLSDPQVSVFPDSSLVCLGDSVLLSASGTQFFQWMPAWWLSSTSGSPVFAIPQQSMSVTLVGTDHYNCRDTAVAFVGVIPPPDIDLGSDRWLGLGEQLTLAAPFGFDHYLWSTGTTGNAILVNDTGTYWVIVRNALCENSDTVRVFELTGIWVPNAFKPDRDNRNDDFSAVCLSCTEIEMQIFDRWGGIVFESHDLDGKWDGTCQGSPCPPDVYVYRIKYRKPSPQHYDGVGVLTGIVVLLR